MTTLFIVAAHGNETFSIPVLERLEKLFPKSSFSYDWIIGNPRAVKKNVRFIDVDMNRNAPGSPTSQHYEERRAAELIRIAETYDLVVDIHGAKSDCGACTIIPYPTLNNLLLAAQLRCKNNVIWNTKDSDKKGPITQHIRKPAVGLECGPKEASKTADELYELISAYLQRQGQTVFPDPKESKWHRVCGKLNKADFKEAENWNDFQTYTVGEKKIVPFLSQNTYADGSFFQLEKIAFENLFDMQDLGR